MNYSKAIFLVEPDRARAVECNYEPGAKPEIFKTLDPAIQVDDIVIVPSSTRHGFTTAKITAVDVDVDMDAGDSMKWIADVFDKGHYDALVKREGEIVGKIKSAEMRQKREAMAQALFKDQEALKALTIDAPPEPKPAT